MTSSFSNKKFVSELAIALPTSTLEQRKIWITTIVEKNISLSELADLLNCEKKISTRFLWLLSELGMLHPDKLFAELPFLLRFCENVNPVYLQSFANYWRFAGVPEDDEAKAIELLFHWLLSPEINVTIKSRAIFVLFELTKKYPELKSELRLCLEDQKDNYSKDFQKRTEKVLGNL